MVADVGHVDGDGQVGSQARRRSLCRRRRNVVSSATLATPVNRAAPGDWVLWPSFRLASCCQVPAGQARLRPGPGRAAAAGTIQREIEDALSEKILFEEVGPGQLVTVDVDNWDGEGSGEDAVFTFVGTKKPAKPTEPELEKAGAAGAPGRSSTTKKRAVTLTG